MLLFKKITIRDFRSFSYKEIEIPSGYLPIVGVNNSGKSNILRALNLFFNDETEPGRPINIVEDFYNPSRKKKKKISISMEFELPSVFNFQKRIRNNLDDLLGRHFIIEKSWSIPESPVEKGAKLKIYYQKGTNDKCTADPDAEYRIRQFLALIRFRYIPNHIHPSEILRKEQNSIQIELLAKLRRSKKVSQEVQKRIFTELGELSKDFVRPIADELQTSVHDIEEIDLSTPTNMGELLFSFSPRLKVSKGETFNALLHGSGVQSLLTLLILRYLDSRFSSRFGWHQATIWAIEEPESFLHKDLEHKVAELLSNIVKPEDSRFQIFCTTHSDVFVRHANKGLLCSLKDGKTDIKIEDARPLSGEASRLGISSYIPPLIFGSPKPLLIVEGPSDTKLIEHAYATLGIACPWEIQSISAISSDALKGVKGLQSYLRASQDILQSRPLKAPVLILLDWNVNDKDFKEFKKLLQKHPTSMICRWCQDYANPDLDESFTGIERYLSTDVILEADNKELLNAQRPARGSGPLSVKRRSIEKIKFADFVINRAKQEDIEYFKKQLEVLNERLVEGQQKALRIEREELFP